MLVEDTNNELVNIFFHYLNEHCEDQTLDASQKEQALQEIANNYFINIFPDQELIKRQYKEISLLLHPDKFYMDPDKFINTSTLFNIVTTAKDTVISNYVLKLISEFNNNYRETGNRYNPFMPNISQDYYNVKIKEAQSFYTTGAFVFDTYASFIERLKTRKLLEGINNNEAFSKYEKIIINALLFIIIDLPMMFVKTIKNELFYFALFLHFKIPLSPGLWLLWPYFGSLTALQLAITPYAIPIILFAIITNGAFLDGVCASLITLLDLCTHKKALTEKQGLWYLSLTLLKIFTAGLYFISNILNAATHFISGLIQRSLFEIICAPFLLFKEKKATIPLLTKLYNLQDIHNIPETVLSPPTTILYSTNNRPSTYVPALSPIPEDYSKNSSPKPRFSTIYDIDE